MVGLKTWEEMTVGDTVYVFHDSNYFDGIDKGLFYGAYTILNKEDIGYKKEVRYNDKTGTYEGQSIKWYRITLSKNIHFNASFDQTEKCDCMNAWYFTNKEQYDRIIKDEISNLQAIIDNLKEEIR